MLLRCADGFELNAGDFAHWQKLLMTNTLAPMILTNLFALGMAERRVSMLSAVT